MRGLLIALPGAKFAQAIFYVHTDSIGSVVAHTNIDATVISRREYEPFGLQITPGIQDWPGYTGQAQDAAGWQRKKLDAQGARAAGVKPLDSEIHNYVTDFP